MTRATRGDEGPGPAGEAPGSLQAPTIRVAIGPENFKFIPIHCLDPSPWNHKFKKFDRRKYGTRLRKFLETSGFRSPLDVWPRPDALGRFYVLDGHQRLPELIDAGVKEVPCIVQSDMDKEDAKFYNAGKDRNRGIFNESGLADHVDELRAELADRQKSYRAHLDSILKPDRPFVPPVSGKPGSNGSGPHVEQESRPLSGGTVDPRGSSGSESSPGGGPATVPAGAGDDGYRAGPAVEGVRPTPAAPAEPRIPLMLSLTTEEYRELDAGLLRCKARPIRSKRLIEAVKQLGLAGVDYDEVIEATALICANRRLLIAGKEAVEGGEGG